MFTLKFSIVTAARQCGNSCIVHGNVLGLHKLPSIIQIILLRKMMSTHEYDDHSLTEN